MGLKVLVVDDDMINRMLLKTLLKKNPKVKEIIEAENGSDALNKFKTDPSINLILLDIMMPIVDGIEFLKIFRAELFSLQMIHAKLKSLRMGRTISLESRLKKKCCSRRSTSGQNKR